MFALSIIAHIFDWYLFSVQGKACITLRLVSSVDRSTLCCVCVLCCVQLQFKCLHVHHNGRSARQTKLSEVKYGLKKGCIDCQIKLQKFRMQALKHAHYFFQKFIIYSCVWFKLYKNLTFKNRVMVPIPSYRIKTLHVNMMN